MKTNNKFLYIESSALNISIILFISIMALSVLYNVIYTDQIFRKGLMPYINDRFASYEDIERRNEIRINLLKGVLCSELQNNEDFVNYINKDEIDKLSVECEK